MAREAWLYREVAVQSVRDASGRLRIAPLPGQAFASSMRVQCSRALLTDYPAGTCFLLSAKMTDRGGDPFLYAWHGDPVRVLTPAEAQRFLGEYRRLRV